jgi:hypothetical protein
MRERPIAAVPKPTLFLLAFGLAVQILWHVSHPPRTASAENLPPPPSLSSLELASFGEQMGVAKLLTLYVQAFDNQPGIIIPFRDLDYDRLQKWLTLPLKLDPPGQYPLFAASRLYGEVPDPAKERMMFNFVYQQFFIDPNRRWPWLANAAVMTKHHLHDLPQARRYAQAIRQYATGKDVPSWARQMEIFILEDMSEYDSARLLLGGLLHSGQITDPHELRFLEERLDKIEAKAKSKK